MDESPSTSKLLDAPGLQGWLLSSSFGGRPRAPLSEPAARTEGDGIGLGRTRCDAGKQPMEGDWAVPRAEAGACFRPVGAPALACTGCVAYKLRHEAAFEDGL